MGGPAGRDEAFRQADLYGPPRDARGNRSLAKGKVAAIYPASCEGAIASPRALMEFARIPVLISLAVSAAPAFVQIRFSGMQNLPFMPSP
mgnify:CR=1 FL=1